MGQYLQQAVTPRRQTVDVALPLFLLVSILISKAPH